MEVFGDATQQLLLGIRPLASLLVLLALSVVLFAAPRALWAEKKDAPGLSDAIPFVSNTYQYMTDKKTFLARASQALSRSTIVRFYLGPLKVYLITGAPNVQALFRASHSISSDKFMLIVFEHIQGWPKEDVARFAEDKSGRTKTPLPGTENMPSEKRVWHGMHHLYGEYLSRTRYTNALAASFNRFFGDRVERFSAGEPATIRVAEFLRRHVAEAAAQSMFGTRILDICPGFVDAMWDFDLIAEKLAFGLPRWINPRPWEIRERYHGMTRKWYAVADKEFDWDGPDVDADYEDILGCRFTRETARWGKELGLSPDSIGSFLSMQVFAINGNSIPVITWAVMEMIKDRELFLAIRKEALEAYVTDAATGKKVLDAQKLLSMPLMQSVFTEALRLHVSINVTREVVHPTTLDGYELPKGVLIQAPSQISQHSEAVWGVPGHPASEFWAARHLKTVEQTDEAGKTVRAREFTTAGSNGHFYPFGGGVSICPGRHFAKQEVLMVLATVAARFDVEFVEWTMPDGSLSDRPAENDTRYAGAAAVPPDRDMKVTWKRLW